MDPKPQPCLILCAGLSMFGLLLTLTAGVAVAKPLDSPDVPSALQALAFQQAEDDETIDSTEVAPTSRTPASRRKRGRFYWGGNVGLSITGSYTQIRIEPLFGYHLSSKTSVGGKLAYEYLQDRRNAPRAATHNYGGSAFTRYRFIPGGFAQLEFQLISYDLFDGRTTVPFLLVGGGYARPLGQGVWFIAEFLMDVIQSGDSPYRRWEPRVNVGINAGF